MKVMVIGKGGREHALVKALNHADSCSHVYALPGSDGMSGEATIIKAKNTDKNTILEAVLANKIDLVVIGPEAELVDGCASFLREKGVLVVGPGLEGAQLEASKIHSKQFMEKAGVPTSRYVLVESIVEVQEAAKSFTSPFVLKADGLCAGKGVYICQNLDELNQAARELFEDKIFGDSGSRAILEEFKPGKEISFLVLTNGKEFSILPLCQDHKRLADGDAGPNTGGMGAVGPISLDAALRSKIIEQVVEPSVKQLDKEGIEFNGILYIGLMVQGDDVSVLEYNVRLGDPEAQIILPLLDGDWADVFYNLAQGQIVPLKWKSLFAACVVLGAENYPISPVKGAPIDGNLESNSDLSYFIHAGTKKDNSQWTTNGGRVLNAIGLGISLQEAVDTANNLASKVQWHGLQKRTDIGLNVLKSEVF